MTQGLLVWTNKVELLLIEIEKIVEWTDLQSGFKIKDLIFLKLKYLLIIQLEMQIVYLICESEGKEKAINYRDKFGSHQHIDGI